MASVVPLLQQFTAVRLSLRSLNLNLTFLSLLLKFSLTVFILCFSFHQFSNIIFYHIGLSHKLLISVSSTKVRPAESNKAHLFRHI